MSKRKRWLLLPALAALLLLGTLVSQVLATEASPVFPHKFYGALTVGGEDVVAGSAVSATGPGVEADTNHNPIVTDVPGRYGDDSPISPDKLLVQGSYETVGQPLEFYVNGVRAETGTSCQGVANTW